MEPGETKTQTQNRNRRRRIERLEEILRPINGTFEAVSSAVPDLGAGFCAAKEWFYSKKEPQGKVSVN